MLRNSQVIWYPFMQRKWTRSFCSIVKAVNTSLETGPDLRYFLQKSQLESNENASKFNSSGPLGQENLAHPYLDESTYNGNNRKVHFEVHGCQMNVSDTEVIWSILQKSGYQKTEIISEADIILIVTCAIREGAENKIWIKLKYLRKLNRESGREVKVGILGCMAERLKEKILEREKLVDLVAGPDSYKDLPRLLAMTQSDQKAVNVLLSLDETYADVMPVRLNQDSVTSFLSIMRGCDNMCTYCIVPFTRGRERSRPIHSILEEVRVLSGQGIKEITLLGQNVNSYRDTSQESHSLSTSSPEYHIAKGFKTVYKPKKGGIRFAELLDKVSLIDPEIRIRFTSPHPKDFPDEVLQLMKERNNICKFIHLPAQSGNTEVLEKMRRGYSREAYMDLVYKIRSYLPDVALCSDFIVGFCGETEEQFQDTVSLLKEVKYHIAYMFGYSMREKTTAFRRYEDNIKEEVKRQRIEILRQLYRSIAEEINTKEIGKNHLILVEGASRKSDSYLVGKTDSNLKVLIPAGESIPTTCDGEDRITVKSGDYVCVRITQSNSQGFRGTPLFRTSLTDYYANNYEQPLKVATQ